MLKNRWFALTLSAQHEHVICNAGKFKWVHTAPVWQRVRLVSPAAGYLKSPLCGAGVSRLFAFSSKDGVSEAARCLEECLTMCGLDALRGHGNW